MSAKSFLRNEKVAKQQRLQLAVIDPQLSLFFTLDLFLNLRLGEDSMTKVVLYTVAGFLIYSSRVFNSK